MHCCPSRFPVRCLLVLPLALLILSACSTGPHPHADCSSAGNAMRYVDQSVCLYGTLAYVTRDLPALLFTFKENSALVGMSAGVAIPTEWENQCVEVRGVVRGKAGSGNTLSLTVSSPGQITRCPD